MQSRYHCIAIINHGVVVSRLYHPVQKQKGYTSWSYWEEIPLQKQNAAGEAELIEEFVHNIEGNADEAHAVEQLVKNSGSDEETSLSEETTELTPAEDEAEFVSNAELVESVVKDEEASAASSRDEEEEDKDIMTLRLATERKTNAERNEFKMSALAHRRKIKEDIVIARRLSAQAKMKEVDVRMNEVEVEVKRLAMIERLIKKEEEDEVELLRMIEERYTRELKLQEESIAIQKKKRPTQSSAKGEVSRKSSL